MCTLFSSLQSPECTTCCMVSQEIFPTRVVLLAVHGHADVRVQIVIIQCADHMTPVLLIT